MLPRFVRILTPIVGIGVAWLAFHAGDPAGAGLRHARPHAIVRANTPGSAERGQLADRLGTAAVGFVANLGQADPAVRFHGAGAQAGFYASDRGMTAVLGTDAATEVLMLRFLGGANPHPRITPSELLGGTVNVLRGPQPKTGLARFRILTYESVWPGIDVRFHAQGGILKYEFLVAPGADPGRIQLAWDGAESLTLAPDGALRLKTGRGPLTDAPPVSFQSGEQVATRYVLESGDRFGFEVGNYDHERPLVIDPGLLYWTFLGGSDTDVGGVGVAVDAAGDVYVTGHTLSPNFPSSDQPKVATGYDQTRNLPGGGNDVFVVKLDPRGETLLYWTFLGGSSNDEVSGIAVDAAGAAYVTGHTDSPDFPSPDRPTAAPGYDHTYNGSSDAFVVKLDPLGETLVYWTFLGGSHVDAGFGIAVDAAGAAYVTGYTESPDFPGVDPPTVAPGYDQTFNGIADAFVVKLDPLGETLAYWTVLGGSLDDIGYGIAVDAAGAAYVTGYAASPDFPSADQPKVSPGYDQTHSGSDLPPRIGAPFTDSEAFIVKLDPRGETLAYWTLLGARGEEKGRGIAVDPAGAVYVTGEIHPVPDSGFPSADQPTAAPGYDQTLTANGDRDVFVVKLDPLGTSLVYWTFLGGVWDDLGRAIAVDATGAAYVTGFTTSPDFPSADQPKVAAGYDQTRNPGASDGHGTDTFVVKLDPQGALIYWSFLGGTSIAQGYGIAVDATGAAYVTGAVLSPGFPNADQPTLAPGYDQTPNGKSDAFVVKLDTTRTQPNQAPVVTNPGPQSRFQGVGLTLAMVAVDGDSDPLTWSALNLPPGITINASSGLLSGTPTAIGVFTVVVSASDLSASGQVSFTWSIVSPLPGNALPLSPSGSVATAMPTFSWSAGSLASYYLLRISDASVGAPTDVWYTPAQANCASGAGTCTVAAPRALLPGLVSWKVLTWNPYGYGQWSPPMSAVVDLTDLSTPTPAQSGPSGPIATRTPTYQWGRVEGATWYQLSVTDAIGATREFWYAPAEACPGASCGVTPNVLLPIGPANWRVRAWRAAGAGVWSPSRSFEPADSAPGKATLLSPAAR